MPSVDDYEKCRDFSGSIIEQNSFLLASALVEAGGFPIPPHLLLDKIDFITGLSVQLHRRMVYALSHYIVKSVEQEQFFEAFCYENISRNLWFQWKQSQQLGYPLPHRDYPLTPLQINWVAYNAMEDERERINHSWSHSFFVASSMNPKGVEKVRQKWEESEKKEKEYREKVKEEGRKGRSLTDKARDKIRNEKSVEDLQREYHSWVAGEEDEHDKLVNQYKNWVQSQIHQRSHAERLAQHNGEKEELLQALQASSSMSSPIRTLSDEDVARIASQKAKNRGVVNELSEYDHRVTQILNPKYSQEPPPSLMDQISNRKVT